LLDIISSILKGKKYFTKFKTKCRIYSRQLVFYIFS